MKSALYVSRNLKEEMLYAGWHVDTYSTHAATESIVGHGQERLDNQFALIAEDVVTLLLNLGLSVQPESHHQTLSNQLHILAGLIVKVKCT